MIGSLFRWLGGQDNPPPSRPRNNFGDAGKGRPANHMPRLYDGETILDSTWEYIDRGLREGWIVDSHDHYWAIRNGRQTLMKVYHLCGPKW